jgi:peptide-methionine (R)-S-oxide reductase
MTTDDRTPDEPAAPDLDGLRERLDALQWHVTQEAGTEAPFTGVYWDCHDDGMYRCVVCRSPLFRSDTKFESGSGWPSFWEPVSPDAVVDVVDRSHGMVRTETRCGTCGAHLGHVFNDGPRPTGLRYCMNSAALELEPERGTDGAAAPVAD